MSLVFGSLPLEHSHAMILRLGWRQWALLAGVRDWRCDDMTVSMHDTATGAKYRSRRAGECHAVRSEPDPSPTVSTWLQENCGEFAFGLE